MSPPTLALVRMTDGAIAPAEGSAVILGAGYAGLTLAKEVHRRSRGKIPVLLVDRHPVHVLRTQLYEIDRIATAGADPSGWAIPLAKVFERSSVTLREGSVRSIDLDPRTVALDTGELTYRSLAICLGNVPAYYGVPGAEEHTDTVYRLSGAQRLAAKLRAIAADSARLPGERRPRIVVVGGGSTGTELAAEIASADWRAQAGPAARDLEVVLLTGSLPFLAGLPPSLIDHAREELRRLGVAIVYGLNVARVDADRLTLEDGTTLTFAAAVWCAGLQAPALVRDLPVPHGHGGRIAVTPELEIPDRPGCWAIGDVAELRDPATGLLVPGTAQAAMAQARTAAENLVARWTGRPLRPFRYRERGTIVALGARRGAGAIGRWSLWGRPAALVKRFVQREYQETIAHDAPPRLL